MIPDKIPSKSIFPTNDEETIRTDMFVRRFTNLKSRLKRLKHNLISVEATKNSKNAGNICVTYGLIVKGVLNEFCVEDDTDQVALDFTGTEFVEGCYFMENCFYILEGFYDGITETLKVLKIALPPIESATQLRSVVGTTNLFGTKTKKCVSSNSELKRIEQNNPDIFFVLINEFWMDSPKCMQNFEKMLSGFISNQAIPAAFVITGNFSSQAHMNELVAINNYQANFLTFSKNLADNFKEIAQQSRFIFIPGSKDPGPISQMLPRPAILKQISHKVQKYLPNSVFTSNPCRIQYCSKEIVICKIDLVRVMDLLTIDRTVLHEEKNLEEKINATVQTIKSQAHVSPLPLDVQPVLDTRDHCLELTAFPDLLVYGEGALNIKQFNYQGVVSPGSFGERALFQVYFPANGHVEDSEIAEDETNESANASKL